MKGQALSSGTDTTINQTTDHNQFIDHDQTIDYNETHPTPSGPIAIGHPVEIFLFPIRLKHSEVTNTCASPNPGAPFKPHFGLSGEVPTVDIDAADDTTPLDLCASADEPPKPRRPSLSRGKPRLGLGGPQRRLKFTAKRLGEIAEAKFLAKAADLGFTVLKPWGDSEAYDFVLDPHRGRDGLRRVQVKSAHRKAPDRGYSFSAHDFSLRHYRARDVDAFVAHVVPEDAWYVIPIRALYNTRGIHLFPSSKRRRSKYEKYRDAWWRLEK